ncbi:MAG: ThiF family adenylyltransferase [Bacteroidales bacterium]|nr:ThiF family adenylyltransferase [Bacteroidales bacterium]
MQEWKERTRMLVGEQMLRHFEDSTVAVIGVGGVGGYAAEMLVRAGIGHLIILDSDTVSVTNKNRQLLALDSTAGKPKCEVLAERLKDINPQLDLVIIDKYLEAPSSNQIQAGSVPASPGKTEGLPADVSSGKDAGTEEVQAGDLPGQGYVAVEDNTPSGLLGRYRIDFLVDAIDTLAPKLALIKYCVDSRIPHVSSMGAGAKFDVTKIRVADISKSFNCPLAYIVRKRLRHMGISKGFKVVFSEELPDDNAIVPAEERNKKSQVGTISYLPAVFGCACAQVAVQHLMASYTEADGTGN